MQQREGFSARTLALSTAAAELGRVILRAGQSGSVRAALLGNVLATAALVLLVVLVSWNAARLRRPGFVGNCCCAAFLFWYLWELVRTAAVHFLSMTFAIPYPLYLLLIVILIWASINVVNCTDGVDGLSASLAVVSIGTFLLAYGEELGDYSTAAIVFIGALLAYLWSNAKPSSLLMGDAGSRAMGFFLAILALKSGHPFAFLLAALVFIVDGSLGILKISFKRFLHISILRNTLTPLHDHVRKRLGWSDEQVVARWLILQAVASALLLLMVR